MIDDDDGWSWKIMGCGLAVLIGAEFSRAHSPPFPSSPRGKRLPFELVEGEELLRGLWICSSMCALDLSSLLDWPLYALGTLVSFPWWEERRPSKSSWLCC